TRYPEKSDLVIASSSLVSNGHEKIHDLLDSSDFSDTSPESGEVLVARPASQNIADSPPYGNVGSRSRQKQSIFSAPASEEEVSGPKIMPLYRHSNSVDNKRLSQTESSSIAVTAQNSKPPSSFCSQKGSHSTQMTNNEVSFDSDTYGIEKCSFHSPPTKAKSADSTIDPALPNNSCYSTDQELRAECFLKPIKMVDRKFSEEAEAQSKLYPSSTSPSSPECIVTSRPLTGTIVGCCQALYSFSVKEPNDRADSGVTLSKLCGVHTLGEIIGQIEANNNTCHHIRVTPFESVNIV
ncbi:unnamed protein product, partial [Protopolystoma xenopodis]